MTNMKYKINIKLKYIPLFLNAEFDEASSAALGF